MITDQYSGIVLDQNATASGSIDWRGTFGSQTIYQTFFLPSHYEMGSTSVEQRLPDLSGFQIMVGVDTGFAETATLDCVLDHYIVGEGWQNLATGTAIGCPQDGQGWFDAILSESVPLTSALASSLFRLGVTTRSANGQAIGVPVQTLSPNNYAVNNTLISAQLIEGVPFLATVNGVRGFLVQNSGVVTWSVQQGVGHLYYVSPNPLGSKGQAFKGDGTTPLLGAGTSASLNFRVLGLTADSGTDFLGNDYRSCVVQGTASSSSPNGWMSTPQPSSFAVVSRYFDVRPAPVLPPIGAINQIPNPNFEHDGLSQAPYWWIPYTSAATTRAFQVVNTWSASPNGAQSCRITGTSLSSSSGFGMQTPQQGLTVVAGAAYSAQATVNVLENDTGGPFEIRIFWYDANNQFIGAIAANASNASPGIQTVKVGGVAPSNALYAVVVIDALMAHAGQAFDALVSNVCFEPQATPVYGDGDTINWEWTGQAGHSASVQLLEDQLIDDTVVIDGILVDPLTPNMAFNVYYSVDDANTMANMTESDWEQKLWVRVPQVYTCTQRQQYVFPAPVVAKYIKVEFTNLPAASYNPGNFQQSTTYKKFPTWVADFFIAQLESPSFVASQVNVQNDALTFAYDYYLDDLSQSPSRPVSDSSSQIPNLGSYFTQSDAEGLVDATTLANINLVMQSFRLPTGSILASGSLLSQAAVSSFTTALTPGTSEQPNFPNINYTSVSSLIREPVVFEQSLPVMFFFLTCRHTYKVLQAQFEQNRAYFAGTNDIQFLRHNYEAASDTPLYIESGADNYNSVVQDFVVDADGNWYTY
jgi:plastocyanin